MTSTPENHTSDDHRERQRQSRAEWQHLCETLESAQGNELCRSCRDKYQFVKTYRNYGRDFDQLVATLRKSARAGQYQFFRERGVPHEVLTPSFVDLLLDDWKSAIQAKKRQAAEVYRFRFHENIDQCIVTGEDSAQLGGAEGLHAHDALLQLSGKGQPTISLGDMDHLRSEVQDLRASVDQLSQSLRAEIADLKRRLDDRGH